MDWQPIETMPIEPPFNVLVAWRVQFPDMGAWWEFDTDPFNDGATHWARFDDPTA